MIPIGPIPPMTSETTQRANRKANVELADGKERNIQHMMVTSFGHPGGVQLSFKR